MKMTKACIGQVICFLLIKLLYTYVTVVTLDGLSYSGSIGGYYIDYNLSKDMISYLVMLMIAIYYSRQKFEYNTVAVVLHVLFIFYYIPINSAYAIHNLESDFFVLSSIYFLFIIILLGRYKAESKQGADVVKEPLLNRNAVNAFCLIICLAIIIFKLLYNGWHFSMSIESDIVYGTREAFNEKISRISGTLLGYLYVLFSDIGSTVAPLYLFIALRRRKIGFAIVAIVAILSEYSMTRMKGDLFGIVLVIGIYVAYELGWLEDFRKFMNWLFVGIMAFCFIERAMVRVGWFYFLMIRRVFFTPARLSYLYYDFFSKHDKLLLSDSVIGLQRLLPHVYDVSPLKLISDAYYSGIMDSPNTGLFGAAYMQLGILGIILQPILIFVLARWADGILRGYGKGFIAVVSIVTVMSMQNVPILRADFILSKVLVIALFGFLPMYRNGVIRLRVKRTGGRAYHQGMGIMVKRFERYGGAWKTTV